MRAQVTISPSQVQAGSSATITASTASNFSLSTSGGVTCTGCGTAGQTSVTLTAAAGVSSRHLALGVPAAPNDSVWNTPISALPVNSNSATWITNSYTGYGIKFEYQLGYSRATGSTQTKAFTFYYGGTFTSPTPAVLSNTWKRQSGSWVGIRGFTTIGANQPDHHSVTINTDTGQVWDVYNDFLSGHTETCTPGVSGCNTANSSTPFNAASGLSYSSASYLQLPANGSTGTTAAGTPIAPMNLAVDEIKSGTITHALHFTTTIGGCWNSGSPYWPAPAVGLGCSGTSGPPPLGARFRLKASFSISGQCTGGTTAANAACTTVLTALQNYGMVLDDIGTGNTILIDTSCAQDPDVIAGLNEATGMGIANFEVVDESTLQQKTTNGWASSSTYAVDPGNTYVTPSNYATLTVTPSGGSAVKFPIAIVPLGVGTPSNRLFVLAGSYSYGIPTWVTPSTASQTVTLTKTSGVGSVSGTSYTPPADLSGGNAAVLTLTASADSAASTKIYVTVLPPGTNPVGTIRIDSGSQTGQTIGSDVWLPDQASEGYPNYPDPNGDYPHWANSDPNTIVYESALYSTGAQDIVYSFILPNGNYQACASFGRPGPNSAVPFGSFGDIEAYTTPYYLEANGQIAAHYYNWPEAAGVAVLYRTSTLQCIPARVTNNTLYYAVRAITPDAAPYYSAPYKSPYINSLKITPDATAAGWQIDTAAQLSITPGTTLAHAFCLVDKYTGANLAAATWSVTGRGASITTSTTDADCASSATVSLASGTFNKGQPITVSATNGTYSASATIYTNGSTALRR